MYNCNLPMAGDFYLAHFGIKGQRWGIRRYQNPDGTWTEAGKKRYGTIKNFEKAKVRNKLLKRGVKAGALFGATFAATAVVPAILEAYGQQKTSKLAYSTGRAALATMKWALPTYMLLRTAEAGIDIADIESGRYQGERDKDQNARQRRERIAAQMEVNRIFYGLGR